jgi:hypothetical protein
MYHLHLSKYDPSIKKCKLNEFDLSLDNCVFEATTVSNRLCALEQVFGCRKMNSFESSSAE